MAPQQKYSAEIHQSILSLIEMDTGYLSKCFIDFEESKKKQGFEKDTGVLIPLTYIN